MSNIFKIHQKKEIKDNEMIKDNLENIERINDGLSKFSKIKEYKIIIEVNKKEKNKNDKIRIDQKMNEDREKKKELKESYKNGSKNTLKINRTKKRKNNVDNNKNKKIINFTIIFAINIINIICHIKNQIFDLFNLQDSKIILKIRGFGDIAIFGNETNHNFEGINHLKEVYINENKQNSTEYRYYFTRTNNIVELIWDDDITNCQNMFYKCTTITEINLSNFNTSQVTSMSYMFEGCSSLISLNLSNINTSLVTSMSNMFKSCSSLTSLDLIYFNTSLVTSMSSMFEGCTGIKSLNLSNFDTSRVTDMSSMFNGCSDIKSLNLSNFDTSLVSSMSSMFVECSSLNSLNLSSFNTSRVTDMSSMFYYCSSLYSLDLSNFDTSQVISMSCMFDSCQFLDSLNISNFNTSHIKDFSSMFNQCFRLASLNLTNFNTSHATDMSCMFSDSSISLLDLSTFDTSHVEDMSWMFYLCSSLTSLNLSNFDTSKVTDMSSMFYYCSSLFSLDLSNFKTSQVTDMSSMFFGCSSLISLDLSNFNTSLVTSVSEMLSGCRNLEYVNLINFDESKLDDDESCYENMFNEVPENIVICINESITMDKIFPQITTKTCYVNYCSDDWKSKQKKIINNNECIESCDNSPQYKYEYNGKCYDNCSYGFYNDENKTKCKCELEYCLECPNAAKDNNLCTKCNINYYPKENDPSNIGEYISCYNNPEGYYLDNNLFKQCYYTCKTCNITGNNLNHNCIECNDNYPIKFNTSQYFNCYENCSYYHYFDEENNYHCTLDSFCPKDYPVLNKDTMECLENDIINIIYDIIQERNKTDKMTKEEEIEYYDNLLKIIEKGFTENFDTKKLDMGNDEIIETVKMTVTLTTTENQRNKIYKNMTTIDLGICENLLRDYYNISKNEFLYIKKIDVFQERMKIPKVEYDIYSKGTESNLKKLNLTVCGNSKITISIPYNLSESLDILNTSSGYYNDICYTTTSEDGTDLTLKDRQIDFVDKNKTVCQEDCLFSNYDSEKMKVECSCEVKESPSSIADMYINKAKLFENFKDIRNIINFDFLICYKKLLKKDGIINNIGCYITLFIIFFHIISIFVFSMHEFSFLKKKIKNITFGLNKYSIKEKNKKNEKNIKNESKSKLNDVSIYKKPIIRKGEKINIKYKKKIEDNNSKRKLISKKNIQNQKNSNTKKKNLSDFIDEEINELSYELAIQYDKRNFWQTYFSLVKIKHSLINALFNNDYNSKIIKTDLFFIGFAIEYTLNALFYNDDTMYKIYKNKGQFDLESQIPIAIYSYLISIFFN